MRATTILLMAASLLAAPITAQASIVDGTFSGVIDTSLTNLDSSGVFGAPNTDLSGSAITGTFVYDTNLFSQSIVGTANTATGTTVGALTVTVSIGGVIHVFSDVSSSSINVDSSASLLSLDSSNTPDVTTSEIFSLLVLDPGNPFLFSSDLGQAFDATPAIGSGTFTINDSGSNALANASFSVTQITEFAVPEPSGLGLVLAGLLGLAGVRPRRSRVG